MSAEKSSAFARILDEQHRNFVGRRSDIANFTRDVIQAPSPRFNVYMVWGVGGIGKTCLLRELQLRAGAASANVSAATLETAHTAIDLMRAWREHLPGKPFRRFDRDLRRYANVTSKLHQASGGLHQTAGGLAGGILQASRGSGIVGGFIAGAIGEERIRAFVSQYLTGKEASVFIHGLDVLTRDFVDGVNETTGSGRTYLFLDYYEAATSEIDQWLRRVIASELSDEAVLVIAGRESLRQTSPTWVEFAAILQESELTPLSEPEVAEYLDRVRVLEPKTRREVTSLAAGIPWALALSVDALKDLPAPFTEQETDRTASIRTMVVSRFLSQLAGRSAELRETVEAAAVTAWFDRDLLQHLVDHDISLDIERLLHFSFFSIRRDGKYVIKDAVREAVVTLLRQRNPQRWTRTNERAAHYHLAAIADTRPFDTQWSMHFLEVVRHTVEVDLGQAVDLFTTNVAALPIQIWKDGCAAALALLENADRAKEHTRVRYYSGLSSLAGNDLEAARDMLAIVIGSSDPPPWMRMRAYAGVIDIEHRLGDVQESLRVAVTAHDAALSVRSDADAAIFAARAAEMSGSLGDEQQSQVYLGHSQAHLEICQDDLARGQAELILCYANTFASRYADGAVHLDRALRHWQAAAYEFGTAQVHSARSWLAWLTGDIAAGITSAQIAIDYFGQIGDRYNAGLATLNMAELERRRGNAAAAIEWNTRADSSLTETGGLLYHAIVQYRIGRAYLDIGEPQRAIGHLTRSIQIQREKIGEKFSQGLAELYLAEAYAAVGDARAAATVEAAQRTLLASSNKYGHAAALILGSAVLAGCRPDRDVSPQFIRGVAMARKFQFWDLMAAGLAEQAIAGWRAHLPDNGVLSVDAVVSARRHSSYHAEAVLEKLSPVLRGLTAEEKLAARALLDRAVTRNGPPEGAPGHAEPVAERWSPRQDDPVISRLRGILDS